MCGSYFDVVGVPMAIGRALRARRRPPGDSERGPRPLLSVVAAPLQSRSRCHRTNRARERQAVRRRRCRSARISRDRRRIDEFLDCPDRRAATASSDTSRTVADALTSRAAVWVVAIGRLKPGVSLSQARDDAARIARGLEREYPDDNRGRDIGVELSRPVPAAGRLRPRCSSRCCSRLSSSFFSSLAPTSAASSGGVARSREMSLRLALGASRDRIVRLVVTESVLLSSAGALGGIALSLAMIQMLRGLVHPPVPSRHRLSTRLARCRLSVALSAGAGLICGLIPSIEIAPTDLVAALKAHSSTGGTNGCVCAARSSSRRWPCRCCWSRQRLLLGRSLMNATVIDPGFSTRDVAAVNFNLRLGGYDNARGAVFAEAALRRIEQLPEVESAATSLAVPLTLAGVSFGPLRLPGEQFDVRSAIFPDWNVVSPRYYETIGIGVVQGRPFNESDRAGAADVVIINQTLAARLFAGQNPVGRRLVHRSGPPPGRPRALEVVGVARDSKYRSLGEAPRPFAYVPAAQRSDFAKCGSWRARQAATSFLRCGRSSGHGRQPAAVAGGTLSELTAFGLLPQRLAAWLAAGAGIVAVLFATIGIYGIAAHNVAQRRSEMGIRMALGAQGWQVLGMVIRHAVALTGISASDWRWPPRAHNC